MIKRERNFTEVIAEREKTVQFCLELIDEVRQKIADKKIKNLIVISEDTLDGTIRISQSVENITHAAGLLSFAAHRVHERIADA